MSVGTVLVTDYEFENLDPEREIFRAADVEMVTMQAETSEDIIGAEVDPDALLVQYAEITRDVIEAYPDLSAIGVYGIGVDNIDVNAANERGIPVLHVPDYCITEVAEHVLGLIMACERKISSFDSDVKADRWDWTAGRPIRRVSGRTLGVVGLGRIGRQVVKKTEGLDLTVIGTDPYVSETDLRGMDVELTDFPDLLARADIVTVHTPLTDETERLVDADAFDAMNDDATFINAARGPIVDVEALADALQEGEIGAAGLDVLPNEPPGKAESRLFSLDNVVLTPHMAWYSEQSIVDLRKTIANDVSGVLSGDEPQNPVRLADE